MKYHYMKRSLRHHLFRKSTKCSRKFHKFFLLILLNVGVTTFNVNMYQKLTQPWVFVNPSIAKAAEAAESESMDDDINHPAPASTDSVSDIIGSLFPARDAQLAKAVAYAESRHVADKASDLDIMKDGRPFSVGVFQINLTWHTINGVNCSDAFHGKNKRAVVIDEELYTLCVRLASDPNVNVKTALEIYERSGQNFGQWSTFTSRAYVPFLRLF